MDFVFVHGTSQSPAGWQRLIDELAARGHHGTTVDLRTHQPELTLDDYAHAAADQVDGLRTRRPIVVAHSGSGILLPAIAEAVEAAAVVWLAAYIPDFINGRSLVGELEADATALFNPDWIGINPVADHDAARRFLFHDCGEDFQEWAISTLREFAPAQVYNHNPAPRRPLVASTYILPTADPTLRPDWMRRAVIDRLGVHPVEIDAGHCPHVSHPAMVADILAGLQPKNTKPQA